MKIAFQRDGFQIIFLNVYFYLLERYRVTQEERDTERDREKNVSPTGSLPKYEQQLDMSQAKVRARKCIQASYVNVMDPITVSSIYCLQGCTLAEN